MRGCVGSYAPACKSLLYLCGSPCAQRTCDASADACAQTWAYFHAFASAYACCLLSLSLPPSRARSRSPTPPPPLRPRSCPSLAPFSRLHESVVDLKDEGDGQYGEDDGQHPMILVYCIFTIAIYYSSSTTTSTFSKGLSPMTATRGRSCPTVGDYNPPIAQQLQQIEQDRKQSKHQQYSNADHSQVQNADCA